MEDIRFDDIDRLKTKISDQFSGWSEPLEITQDMIQKFADLTGDQQWIHVDVERAKRESPFKAPIAHGFLTLSLLPAMKREPEWKISGYGNATNYGANKLRFVSPVPAGARIRARITVQAVEKLPEGFQVTWHVTIEREHADKPACVADWIVRYYPVSA